MLADFRHALRQLCQSPAFTAVAVVSLALGIGANTAIFSLVNEYLLRSLPVREPERLVIFRNVEGVRGGGLARSIDGYGGRDPATGRFSTTSFPLALVEQFRARRAVLEEAFAFVPFWQAHVLIDGQPISDLGTQFASGSYFTGLGVSAQLGRVLTAEDDRVTAEPVAVISHRLWQRHFAGSPTVLGRVLHVNRIPVTIVGVTPPGFAGAGQAGEHCDITVPLAQHGRFDPDMGPECDLASTWWVRIMGRLAPGATPQQAVAELEPVFVAVAREGWRTAPRESGEVVGEMPAAPALFADSGARGEMNERQRHAPALATLSGLVALVLLAACANVANLLLARSEARRREIAVRLALGAGRARVVRLLLAESLLIASAAATSGVALAWLARGALLALRPFGNNAANLTLPLDIRVLAYAVGVSVVTVLLFGVFPALRSTRLDLAAEFQGGRTTVGTRSRLRRALMIAQIALSLLLLVCTGLLVRSLRNLQHVDAGFDRRGLAAFTLNFSAAGLTPAQIADATSRVQSSLAARPGVQGVSFSRIPLLARSRSTSAVVLPGVTPPNGAEALDAHFNAVSANFFAMTRLPVLHGRSFTDADGPTAAKVAVVNEAFVRHYLAGESPVGRRYHTPLGKTEVEIVGVVADAKYADLRSPVPPTVYLPLAQRESGSIHFLVRGAVAPEALFRDIRQTVREIAPDVPVVELRTMEQQIDRLHEQEILFARLSGAFGVLTLALSCVGLYGLMSYAVTRRRGEIGVRMALGALPGDVLRLFLTESFALVVIGLVFGSFAAWGTAHLLSSMLFGLTMADPFTYGAAAALLLAVALLAAAVPAWRAARVDPTEALRTD